MAHKFKLKQPIDEERKGLLSGKHGEDKADLDERPAWSRKSVVGTAIGLILLIVCGVLARAFLQTGVPSYYNGEPSLSASFHPSTLRSNGTHEFKRTVLIVSIDGLRADYLDRGFTPHLLDISKRGLRSKWMKPIFPTLTFPNHWALMTGLHAESHGIVANNFWDPASNSEFHYNRIESCWNSSWWFGEPMWETVEKAGKITANLMWPGPPKTSTGAKSTYFVPWADKIPLHLKLDQITQWIDLPFEERPQLIMAYEPSLDQAGHATGPNSKLVNETLRQVDVFAKELHDALEVRNLTDIVDIVFVSDHGMTDTSVVKMIYMDDILGAEGLEAIEHEDGWPAMGVRFRPNTNETHYFETLLAASAAHPDKFDVYTRETMPERYHFSDNERIAPYYIIPKIGYALTTRKQGDVGMTKGNHGYDNDEPSMHAIFVAHGPFSQEVKSVHQALTSSSRQRRTQGWHSTSHDEDHIIDGFANVEIYNLVMKLLGVSDKKTAPNNGTAGFWDQYLE